MKLHYGSVSRPDLFKHQQHNQIGHLCQNSIFMLKKGEIPVDLC